jgi:hypothetical protein
VDQEFKDINWAEVAYWAGGLRFCGIDRHGAWMCGQTHWGYVHFVVADNCGEVNVFGLNVEFPAISIPYSSYLGNPDEMAMGHRLQKYLANDFGSIDWNWIQPKKELDVENVFAEISKDSYLL